MVEITIVATFPPGYFLENITTTHDGGLFVTCANRQELYYVSPPPADGRAGTPSLIHTFAPDQWAMGIIPAPQHPNVFYMLTSNILGQGSKTSYLHLVDTSNAAAGSRPYPILKFPPETKGLNGLCALSKDVLLAADSFASCVWRIDLDLEHFPPKSARARVWLKDDSMAGKLVLPDFQPGTNGLKYSSIIGRVYYTSTQQHLFCQVDVDAKTLEAKGEVEVVASGMPGDDFILDDSSSDRPLAYITTHRDNSVLKVHLDSRDQARTTSEVLTVIQGGEHEERMLGPTAGVWVVGKVGKSAYFTTDGGLKHPLKDGRPRGAKVVRVDF